jgi:hypothetical protein
MIDNLKLDPKLTDAQKPTNPNTMIKEQLALETDDGKVIWIEDSSPEGGRETTVGALKEKVAEMERMFANQQSSAGTGSNENGERETYNLEEGKISLNELSEKKDLTGLSEEELEIEHSKAGVKHFVATMKYALKVLETRKLIPEGSVVKGLKTVGDSKNLHETSSIPTNTCITLKGHDDVTKERYLEVEIEWDSEYPQPGIAIVNAWYLSSNDEMKRIQELGPLPKPNKLWKFKGYLMEDIVRFARVGGITCLFLGGFLYWLDIKHEKKTK